MAAAPEIDVKVELAMWVTTVELLAEDLHDAIERIRSDHARRNP